MEKKHFIYLRWSVELVIFIQTSSVYALHIHLLAPYRSDLKFVNE